MKNFSFFAFLIAMFFSSCGYYPHVVIETNYGAFEITLDGQHAPEHTENFLKLVEQRFYIGTTFHRVIANSLIQGGDPNSKDMDKSNDGLGGPGYTLKAEIGLPNKKWSVAAARKGDPVNPQKRSNGSQFYICMNDLPMLDGGYSVFGKVSKGFDVLEKISRVKTDRQDNPVRPVIIENAYKK